MFRDCGDYICYKIQDMILKNGQTQNNTQKGTVLAAKDRSCHCGDFVADSGGEGILEYAADGCAGKCFKCVWQCILQGSVRRYFCIWQIWQYGAYGYGKRDYPGKGGRKNRD